MRTIQPAPPLDLRTTRTRRHPKKRALRTVGILGSGSYVPARVLGNEELEGMVDTTDEWIVTRTGIRERHIAAPGQATSDLAIRAGRVALDQTRLLPDELDLILLATATPDEISPSTVSHVQRELGAKNAAGFDINAACSGFVNALMTGHQLVAAGAFGNALILGADTLSSITDYEDRESCVLFGDGAGALVIGTNSDGSEILDHIVGMDGTQADLITVPAGGSRQPSSHETIDRRAHFLQMQGRKVFRFAVNKIVELAEEMTSRNGLTLDDIDLLIPHQANGRIIEAATHALGFDPERVLSNVDRFGNTSNASVPMALDEALRSGQLQPGMLALLVAFGGGLTWGATLISV